MRLWQRLALIGLIIVICVLMMVPVLSLATTDYGNPTARWTETKAAAEEGERSAKITFDESGSLGRLYDLIHAPVRPSLAQLIICCFVLGVAYLLLIEYLTEDDEDQVRGWIFFTMAVQGILVVVCLCVAGLVTSSWDDLRARITASIKDTDLANQAIKAARDEPIKIPGLAFLVFLGGDVVIFLSAAGIAALWGKIINAYDNHKHRLLAAVQGDANLVLRSDGMVEQIRYDFTWRLLPFPAIVPKRTITGQVSWPDLCRALITAGSRQSMDGLCVQFKLSLRELLETIGSHTSTGVVAALDKEVKNGMQAYVEKTVARGQARRLEEARGLLQTVSDTTLRKFKRELVARSGEAMSQHLNEFRQQAISFLERRFTGDRAHVFHDGSTFPDGTKFCLAKGKTTVFVVEERPQVRTVRFREGFSVEGTPLRQDTDFHLAFPFVVFVARFVDGSFQQLHVYFSPRPLQSMTDAVCWPTLPNINGDGTVCLGKPNVGGGNMAEKAQSVIAHFWQSMFSSDLASHYTDCNNPIRNVQEWERQSRQDPAFVLTARWRVCSERLEQIVENLLRAEGTEEILVAEKLVRQSLDAALASLEKAVQDTCGTVTVDKRYAKQVANELSSHLQALGQEVVAAMMTRLSRCVAKTNGNVRYQYDYHMQRCVNAAVPQTFVGLAIQALASHNQLPDTVYQALQKGEPTS